MKPAIVPNENGQSLVELAVSLVFLILIVGGVIDIGAMFYTYLSLRDTAQEGAIYASYDPTNTTAIINRIKSSASFPIAASQINDIAVTCSGAPCSSSSITSCQGQPVTVQVKYRYDFIMPLISTVINSQSWILDATVTDTILQSDSTIDYYKTNSLPGCPG